MKFQFFKGQPPNAGHAGQIGEAMRHFQGALDYFAMGLDENTDWNHDVNQAASEFSNIGGPDDEDAIEAKKVNKVREEARREGEGLPDILFSAVMLSRNKTDDPSYNKKKKKVDRTPKKLSSEKVENIERRYKKLKDTWEELRRNLGVKDTWEELRRNLGVRARL